MKKILTTIALGSTLLTSSLMASDSYKTTNKNIYIETAISNQDNDFIGKLGKYKQISLFGETQISDTSLTIVDKNKYDINSNIIFNIEDKVNYRIGIGYTSYSDKSPDIKIPVKNEVNEYTYEDGGTKIKKNKYIQVGQIVNLTDNDLFDTSIKIGEDKVNFDLKYEKETFENVKVFLETGMEFKTSNQDKDYVKFGFIFNI